MRLIRIGALVILSVMTLLLVALSVGAMFDITWLGNLCSWIRFQLLWATVCCGCTALALKAPKLATVNLFFAVCNAFYIAPYTLSLHPEKLNDSARTLKVCQLNVLRTNTNYDRIANYIKTTNADLVFLQELAPTWSTAMSQRLADYPYRALSPPHTGILSRFPIRNLITHDMGANQAVVISGVIDYETTPIPFVHLHPPPVPSSVWFEKQKTHYANLQKIVSGLLERPFIIGDFNEPPWSPAVRSFAKYSCSARGFGWNPTFPASNWPMEIPIDYLLVPDGMQIKSTHAGPNVGSDHLPVVSEIAVAKLQIEGNESNDLQSQTAP